MPLANPLSLCGRKIKPEKAPFQLSKKQRKERTKQKRKFAQETGCDLEQVQEYWEICPASGRPTLIIHFQTPNGKRSTFDVDFSSCRPNGHKKNYQQLGVLA